MNWNLKTDWGRLSFLQSKRGAAIFDSAVKSAARGRMFDRMTDAELTKWWRSELAQKTPEWLNEPPFCRGCREAELALMLRNGPVPTDIQ